MLHCTLCSVISALENIGNSIDIQPGQMVEVATTTQYSLSVVATTPDSVEEEGLVVQTSLETTVAATLPPVVFDQFVSDSTVMITVSVVTVTELFPPKSGGTVSSVIFSVDVGIEISDLSEPILMQIPADPVRSYHWVSALELT